jgi:hypothetical protein
MADHHPEGRNPTAGGPVKMQAEIFGLHLTAVIKLIEPSMARLEFEKAAATACRHELAAKLELNRLQSEAAHVRVIMAARATRDFRRYWRGRPCFLLVANDLGAIAGGIAVRVAAMIRNAFVLIEACVLALFYRPLRWLSERGGGDGHDKTLRHLRMRTGSKAEEGMFTDLPHGDPAPQS